MIRLATSKDQKRVVQLLHDSHIGAGFDRSDGPTGFAFEFCLEDAEQLFFSHLISARTVCIVYDVNELAQGVLMAAAFKHKFCSKIMMANETAWWIDPAFRGRAAIRMLDFYEAWAMEQGCKYAGMAGMGEDPEIMKLYLRRGYRKAETHCLKEI